MVFIYPLSCRCHASRLDHSVHKEAWKTTDQQPVTIRSLLADLKSCSITRNLERGRGLHAKVLRTKNDMNVHVAAGLVKMYAKCGSMVDARHVFDSISHPDVVLWTTLLMGYADNGVGFVALDLFWGMKSHGCVPDSITYVAALKACISLLKQDGSGRIECLEQGKRVHLEIGCPLDLRVQNTLIDMYAKSGSMIDAHQVFDSIGHPDLVSWNILLSGYAESGEGLVALNLFHKMKSHGCAADSRTYVAVVKACTCLALNQDASGRAECLEQGKQIHSEIGCHLDLKLQSTLIDMYAKCGSMVDARKVFDSIAHPDVVSWNVVLSGYVDNGEGLIALGLFSKMKSIGCPPNSTTYIAALKACTSLALEKDTSERAECLERGKKIHAEIGCHLNLNVQNTLIDMYGKCGSMVDAHQVFESISHPDVVSWTTLLSAYGDFGQELTALDLFQSMKSCGCAPNRITYVAVLKACGLLGALTFGRKVHAEIRQVDTTLVTCLVDFYAKCGSMGDAKAVFDMHPNLRNVTTWTALLAGYSSFGEIDHVFGVFEGMLDAGVHPNSVTFICIFACCSHAGLVEKAMECFEVMSAHRVTPTLKHYNCIADVLGRANKLDDVLALLHTIPCTPNALTWRTLLGACLKWKNVVIGTLAFQSLVSLEDRDAAAYVLMDHIYGVWEEQDMVLQ